jgi:tRNA threonylcarbamoyladenosine biosynthesis protein TsaE
MDWDITSQSPEQTVELGRRIGRQLRGGEVIAVCGLLGSGKTQLIKGITAGAGAKDSKRVNSPTFVIVNEYKARAAGNNKGYLSKAGPLDIYHIDAYRLNSVSEFEMIGFDDFCSPQSVVLIEWADKIESALQAVDYIRVELVHRAKSQREIHIKNTPEYVTL